MKKYWTVVFLLSSAWGFADEPNGEEGPWAFSGFFSQQMNQVSFTNWAAGGENNFASTSMFNLSGNYNHDNRSWENRLEMAYGIIKTADTPMRKSQDKIDFLSKYGSKLSADFSLAGLVNFQSQFDKGYKYPNDSVVVSRFLSPAYLVTAVGVDYKPLPYLSLFLSPATGKFTFVTDPDLSAAGAFGVPAGEKVNPEFGAMASITFDKEVMENVKVNSKMDLFNNYTDSDRDNRKRIDVNWQTSIDMKINRFLSASVRLHMIYDYDVTPDVQLQQMLGVGFSYSF